METNIPAARKRTQIVQRASTGLVVVVASQTVQYLVAFSLQVALARLLTPNEFGQFAYAAMVVGLFNVFTSLANDKYLVQARGDLERRMDTIFTLETVLAVGTILMVLLGAPYCLAAMRHGELTQLVQILSLGCIYSAFRSPLSLYEREMDFVQSRSPAIVAQILAGLAGLYAVWCGMGLWGLVIWRLGTVSLELLIVWALSQQTPRLRADLTSHEVLEALRFGVPLMASSLAVFFYCNIDYVLVDRLLGAEQLGYYWVAFTASHHLLKLKTAVNSVIFPTFCQTRDNEQIVKDFERLTRVTILIYLGPALFFLIWGQAIVAFVLGRQWLPAVGAFKVFMLLVAIRAAFAYGESIYLYHGRSDINMRLALIYAVLIAPSVYLGVRMGGIEGAALGVLASYGVMIAAGCWYVRTLTMHSMSYVPGLLLAPTGATWIGMELMQGAGVGPLVSKVAMSVVAWGVLGWLFERELRFLWSFSKTYRMVSTSLYDRMKVRTECDL